MPSSACSDVCIKASGMTACSYTVYPTPLLIIVIGNSQQMVSLQPEEQALPAAIVGLPLAFFPQSFTSTESLTCNYARAGPLSKHGKAKSQVKEKDPKKLIGKNLFSISAFCLTFRPKKLLRSAY